MTAFLIRTLSQAVQAFLPVAVAAAWLHRVGSRAYARSVTLGLVVAVLLTPVAGLLFRQTVRQSQLEAVLACLAAGLAAAALVVFRRPAPALPSREWRAVLAGAAMLVVVRQTMEIAVVLWAAAFEVRSLDATLGTSLGLLLGIGIAAGAWWAVRSAPVPAAASGAAAFGVLFVLQAALYAFHESAESRWLPWSDLLHAATEPYGPDGIYGPAGSGLVASLPLALGAAVAAGARWPVARNVHRWRAAPALVGTAVIVVLALMARVGDGRATAPVLDAAGAPVVVGAGRLLFRGTSIQHDYGLLRVAALQPPGAAAVSASYACERVSFGGGRGLCLQADRGVFTTYRAVLFDAGLGVLRTFSLGGSPSRTRISPDGRVGAITVFDAGTHSYAATTFSTATTLVDMASGDLLGNLEEFSTWRGGARITAADFNFWGVTFASVSNTFYATLRTAGRTYLVRGDLGLRKMTVLREDVECPALSPDDTRIAFKKRVGTASSPWRIYVLDVASMAERVVASETRSIDDQIEWLDNDRVLYGVPRSSSAVTDVWVAPIDGRSPARVFLPEAESPVVVR